MVQYLLASLSLFFFLTAFAGPCVPTVLQKNSDHTVILPGPLTQDMTTIYYFHNKSKQGIWIDHPTHKAGASAGWSSYLQADNWSSIILSKKEFTLSCASIQPGKVIYLDCSTVLDICTPDKLSLNKSFLNANYWLVENKTLPAFIKALEKRGVHSTFLK